VRYLVYLTILSSVLGQIVKLPLGAGNLYPLDVLVLVSVVFWVFKKLFSRDYSFKVPAYAIALGLFFLWSLATLVHGKSEVSETEFISGFFYWARFVFYSLFSLLIYDQSRKNSNAREKIKNVLILMGLIVAIAGFFQLALYPDLSNLAKEFGYDPHKNRLVSTFLDPNFTAAYLVLGLVLILSQDKISSKSPTTLLHSNVVRLGLGVTLFIALLLTFSRSGWLMFSSVLLLFGLLRSPKLLLVALLAGFLAYFAVPRVQTRISGITDPDDSAKLRLVSWNRAWQIFLENPVFGVGFNLYRPAQERFGFFDPSLSIDRLGQVTGGQAGAGSDSSWLLVLATTGVMGLALYLLLYGQLFFKGLGNLNSHEHWVLALSLFGLLFESQFINSLFYPPILLWFWILVGLTA